MVTDVEQALDEVELKHDGTDGGTLVANGEGNITAKQVDINIQVSARKWHFFCFPFDIELDSIHYDGDYVWRQYDGAARGRREGGWQDLAEGTTRLEQGRGYIFWGTAAGTLSLRVANPDLSPTDKQTSIFRYESDVASDANWNFVGNPYTSYYNIDETSYSAPITVWTGSGYEAYRPGDDDYEFSPYQAFFVQTPRDAESIDFVASACGTYEDAQASIAAAKARRIGWRIDRSRHIINLEATAVGDSTYTDKTRIVLNERQSEAYEQECDAAKFFSTERAIDLFTLGADGTQYSINERPLADGRIDVGISVNRDGTYRLSASRMDQHMWLVDNQTGDIHDLAAAPYEFTASKGIGA